MDLPFTPTFFHKIDAYQRLINIESGPKVPIWFIEKAVLRWAAESNQVHPGEIINFDKVKDTLWKLLTGKDIPPKAIDYLVSEAKADEVFRSLITRGFGEAEPGIFFGMRINETGLLAGSVLEDTDGLKNDRFYKSWISVWWALAGLGVLLLLLNVASAIVGFLKDIGFIHP